MRRITGNLLVDRRYRCDSRGNRGPDRIELYGFAVRLREIRNGLSVAKLRRRRIRRSAPTAEHIARTSIDIAAERLGLSAVEVLVRHISAYKGTVLLKLHIVLLPTVDRMHGQISGHGLVKAIRTAVGLLPVIEDVIRLIIRVLRLHRSSAVRNLVVRRDNAALMSRVCIRCINDRNRIAIGIPNCREQRICRHRIAEVIRRTVRLCPVHEVLSRLIAGRTAGSGCIARCECRIAVAHRLRARGIRAAVRVKAHLVARQTIVVGKVKVTGQRCRCAAVLLHRYVSVHRDTRLAHANRKLIDRRVIAVSGRRARNLRKAIDVIALVDKGHGSEIRITRAVDAEFRLLRSHRAVRHRQCTDSRCRGADSDQLEAEVLRIQRGSLTRTECKAYFSAQNLLHAEV